MDAANQSGDGKSFTVASVSLDAGGKGGWIALHTDVSGKPGPVKYFVAVPAGASSKVVIPTPEGIPTGDYWPMLHVDDHAVGTYDFPKVERLGAQRRGLLGNGRPSAGPGRRRLVLS